MNPCITGVAHSNFGKHLERGLEELLADVCGPAIADAGLAPDEIDAVFLGHFNSGFVDQDFCASLVLGAVPQLRYKPATRVENACATGSAAVHAGLDAVASGRARHVLVVGAEKMTARGGPEIREILLHASYVAQEAGVPAGFAGLFAEIAKSYFARFGDKSDAMARVAVKNHGNGVHNPHAHLRKALSYEHCASVSERNPMVAAPLRRTDCSPVSDGAAALVLSAADAARGMAKAVHVRSRAQVNDVLPMAGRDMTSLEGARRAWALALETARLTLDDLSFVETHDCFTIAELMEYEAMGLTALGQGDRAIEEGWTHRDGRLPVNPSGGLGAKGHPIGATGVSMHVVAAMQLFGEAGGMQLSGATAAGVFNMGGAGVANYVSILERAR